MSLKYFQEAAEDNHYDARFFRGALDDRSRAEALHRLFAHFSRFCVSHQAKPIVMHGSLIGWFWNRKPLPWDNDIDVCFFYADFLKLKEVDCEVETEAGSYLYDVNPNSENRVSENGHHQDWMEQNRIDARFIDKRSGLFIDVTALYNEEGEDYVYTKCPHYYLPKDLLPLQPTRFLDQDAFVPRDAEKILFDEYGASVFSPRHRGYRFDDEVKEWVRKELVERS